MLGEGELELASAFPNGLVLVILPSVPADDSEVIPADCLLENGLEAGVKGGKVL